MCGIVGTYDPGCSRPPVERRATVAAMAEVLAHRGPDDQGVWMDTNSGIVFGHRRLAVIDLSPHGRQPMTSACGRYTITYNGELYNYLDLRQSLEQRGFHTWQGHSDTEVLLAAISAWGVRSALQAAVGMFVFALWDNQERCLFLGRDRLGEKPLYYGWLGRTFVFGSELKALAAHPDWVGEVNTEALSLYLRFGYVPAPYAIYRNLFKVLPGTLLKMTATEFAVHRTATSHAPLTSESYWSALEVVSAGERDPFTGSFQDAGEQFEGLLLQTTRQQMLADVPLGAFLSGGVDSSTIVALMQAQSSRPVRTFTIGFEAAEYDEAGYARDVAAYLGTEHSEMYVTAEQALAVIPRLPLHYDEPFADASQIPTLLVTELARRQVTVCLSGDGGDELLGGYNRYYWVDQIWRMLGRCPSPLRRGLAGLLGGLPAGMVDLTFRRLQPVLDRHGLKGQGRDKLKRLAEIATAGSMAELNLQMVSGLDDLQQVLPEQKEPPTLYRDSRQWALRASLIEQLMCLDLVTFLPDDILVKVDRAAMAVSLESRIPLLDHRLVEFVWRLPPHLKLTGQSRKKLLRTVLGRYLPPALIDRPKTGFSVPVGAWLRGPLREWAGDLLDGQRLRREGVFNAEPITRSWGEFLRAERDRQAFLWRILMFQAWQEYWQSETRSMNGRQAV